MKKYILILLGLFGFSGADIVRAGEDGGYAGAFLKMATESRPAAMGGAYLGVSDDPAGQLHNPAGMHAVVQPVFSSAFRSMKLDRKLGFVSIVFPTRLESALGFSWIYVGYGDVDARNGSGYATGRVISSNEHNFAATFAKLFTPYLALGAKMNYYLKNHDNLKASTIGFNLGGMIYVDSLFEYGTMEGKPVTDIKGGVVLRNVFGVAEYPWDTEGSGLTATANDEFPIVLGVGMSCRTLSKKLLIAADINKNSKQDMDYHVGGEYGYRNQYFLRGGLNDGTITAGAGYYINISNLAFSFNYAFIGDRVNEGEDHLFTIDIKF